MKFISKDNFKEHLRKKFLNKKSTWHIGVVAFIIVLFIHALYLFVFRINTINKGNWNKRPTLTWVELPAEKGERKMETEKSPNH